MEHKNSLLVNTTIEDLIAQRDMLLPDLIASCKEEIDTVKSLDNIKIFMNFLRLYDINNIDDGLLQFLMPALKNTIQKLYEDNLLISNTSDGDFVVNILKENIESTIELLQNLKNIVQFFLQNDKFSLKNIRNVPINFGQSLLITFQNCKNCETIYKENMNSDLLKLFHVAQEGHTLFLKLLESVTLTEDDLDQDEIILTEVLQILPDISEVLTGVNVKSMTINWKSYLAIIQKFYNLVQDSFNLKQIINRLSEEINKQITYLLDLENKNNALQLVKITGFLVKVVLKLFDIFWNLIEDNIEEILHFCRVIYSYTMDHFSSKGYSNSIIDLIDTCLYKSTESFTQKLVNESSFFVKLSEMSHESPDVVVQFYNTILNLTINNKSLTNQTFSVILQSIFKYLEGNEHEISKSFLIIFDELIENTTIAICIYPEIHPKIEQLLFENVIKCNFWNSIFAIEVWCLFLSHLTFISCSNILRKLISMTEQILLVDFMYLPELIYLKVLLKRIFDLLPYEMKEEIIDNLQRDNDIKLVFALEFQGPTAQSMIDQVELLKCGSMNLKQFLLFVNSLPAISAIDLNAESMEKLINSLTILWNFNVNEHNFNNNIFQDYIYFVCKFTKKLFMSRHDNCNLHVMILNQIMLLSNENNLKILVCDILSLYSHKRYLGQEYHKISTLISDIIYPKLYKNSPDIIKIKTLELIEEFAKSNHYSDMINNLKKNVIDFRGEIFSYQSNNVSNIKGYQENCLKIPFHHKCLRWKYEVQPIVKKRKIEMVKSTRKENPATDLEFDEKVDDGDDDDISEVLCRIKSEMKCLSKLLQKDKMTVKNVSDIKIIISQFQSYL